MMRAVVINTEKDNTARCQAGFTLIEILLASIIGVFIAVSATAALRSAAISREKINQSLSGSAEIRLAATLLREDLGNLHRSGNVEETKFVGQLQEQDRTGSSSRLVFYASNRVSARDEKAEGEIYEIEYYLHRDEGKSMLMRRLWPNPHKDDSPAGILTVAAEHIVSFDVMCFDGEQWVNEWPEEMGRTPQLISVLLAGQLPGEKNVVRKTFLLNYARWPNRQSSGGDMGMDMAQSTEVK